MSSDILPRIPADKRFNCTFMQALKYMDNIAQKYNSNTFLQFVLTVIKYLPLILYMEKYIRTMYKESRKRMKIWNAEIQDIQIKLDIVNAKISCQEAELIEREKILKRATEQMHVVRSQVRKMIAKNEDLKRKLELPINFLHLHTNNTSEVESKAFEELIKQFQYDQKEELEEKIPLDKVQDTVSSFNNNTYNSNEDNMDYTIKIVKVTNVYKMSYLQHYLKHKRLQQARHSVLKKKTNNTQKLFNEWHNALKAVTQKEHAVDSVEATGEAMGDHKSYEILHDVNKDTDEPYQDYDIQNQSLRNYCDQDLAGESEIIAMDYTNNIYNRRKYQMSLGDQPALSILPEETNSEIEIERLDIN